MKSKLDPRTLLVAWAVLVATCANAQEGEQPEPGRPVARATPTTQATTEPPTELSATPKVRPLAVTVHLTTSTVLTGTLLDETELPMRTSFGQASIPLAEVAGIKMAQEGNSTTTVILHNGDTITGAVDLPRVNIETEWGKAQVNGPNVAAILFSPGLEWVKDTGLSGDRWKLVEKPLTPGTAEPRVPADRDQRPAPSGVRRIVTADGTVIRQYP